MAREVTLEDEPRAGPPPRRARSSESSPGAGLLAALIVAIAAGLIIARNAPSWHWSWRWQSLPWVPLHVALLLVFLGLAILVHELGHLLMALVLRMRVFSFSIGAGRKVVHRRILGCDVKLHALPLNGKVVAATRRRAWLRPRLALFASGGLLVNAAIAGALLELYPATTLLRWVHSADAFPPGLFVGMLFLSHAGVLTNVIPTRLRKLRPGHPPLTQFTDGWRLLSALFGSESALRAHINSYHVLSVARAAEKGLGEEVIPVAEEAVARLTEDNPYVHWVLGNALVPRREYDRARHHLEKAALLSTSSASWMTANNLALCYLMLGDRARLDDALRLSEEALTAQPQLDLVRATRGAALVAAGRLDAGVALLQGCLERSRSPSRRAFHLGWLALAELARGDREAASGLRDRARSADPSCDLLQRVEQELARTA